MQKNDDDYQIGQKEFFTLLKKQHKHSIYVYNKFCGGITDINGFESAVTAVEILYSKNSDTLEYCVDNALGRNLNDHFNPMAYDCEAISNYNLEQFGIKGYDQLVKRLCVYHGNRYAQREIIENHLYSLEK